ncbi:MAG: rhodanese-like domain-containing protein [Candidatus Omnitrophota bacterium]
MDQRQLRLIGSRLFFVVGGWVVAAVLVLGSASSAADVPAPLPAVSISPAAASAPAKLDGITCEELRKLQQDRADVLILDARDNKSYDMSHIDTAKLPFDEEYYIQQNLFALKMIKEMPNVEKARQAGFAKIPKDARVVTYCNAGCHAADRLADDVRKAGVKDVRVMREGIQAWQSKGYPVVLGKNVLVVPNNPAPMPLSSSSIVPPHSAGAGLQLASAKDKQTPSKS